MSAQLRSAPAYFIRLSVFRHYRCIIFGWQQHLDFSLKRKVLILREKLTGGGNLIIMLRNDTFVAAVTQYQLTSPTSLGLRSSHPSKHAILILVQQN